MRLLYELSWLWEMMGIAMAAAVVCVACAALICKAAKKKLSRKVIAVVAAAAFAGLGSYSNRADTYAPLNVFLKTLAYLYGLR